MTETLQHRSFAGELSGPVFPESLKELTATLERRDWTRKELDKAAGNVGYYAGLNFPFPGPDGYRWPSAVRFQCRLPREVLREMVVLIPKVKRIWLFARKVERPLAVYAWGYSPEQMDSDIRDWVAGLAKLRS